MLNFTALDFETANKHRGSACSVGLIRVRNGKIVDELHLLTQPPTRLNWFDSFNTKLHGITPEKVASAPEWSETFSTITEYIGDDIVAAHNAAFDIGVIRDACGADDINPMALNFVCTLVMSRRAFNLPSYGLPFVANACGFNLQEHHDALADAKSVAQILITLSGLKEGIGIYDLAEVHGIGVGSLSSSGEYFGSVKNRVQRTARTELLTDGPNLDADPDGYLFDRVVVFTGALMSMTRQEAWQALERVGGTPAKDITKRTNVLVVGNTSLNSLRPGAKLTRKAQKAFELQAEGREIEVMTEVEFLQNINTQKDSKITH